MTEPTIIYTLTDEAPALATYSLLPIIQRFTQAAGIKVETRDISLAGRILATFPEKLNEEQKTGDALKELGELAKTADANIIKLPNISASIPQLEAAIKELQENGFDIPNYPADPKSQEETAIKTRYDRIKGSAVNPVLREGNSDRRAPKAVKRYAQNNPHSMGEWSQDSKTRVAHMSEGDYYGSEKSTTLQKPTQVSVVLTSKEGEKKTLKENIPLQAGEIIDAAVMSQKALRAFFAATIKVAKNEDCLLSLHLKATMMKISDPILFGHAISTFFEPALKKHASTLTQIGFNPNNGLGDLFTRLETLPSSEKETILKDIHTCLESGPKMAMVDSDKGITNLHVPSDIIIDASMPAAIRAGGKMWGPDGKTDDTIAMIPDRCYAGVYQETIEFCKKHGAFDVSTMGSVANVGLMAQKAEEYGSHDKTFEIPLDGTVAVINSEGETLLSHNVESGDIWRMCQVKDAPIKDWVKLAVRRAKATQSPAVFWLDENRPHDAELIRKVRIYLEEHDTSKLEILIKAPSEATQHALARCKEGLDTISVTGNVLRDYLTDLFPILELGTSAKMLSIVPLMNGGGLFETGAGGSAPKHVQQLVEENHLRWDSLGEFLALAASLEHLSEFANNDAASCLAQALDQATSQLLETNKSPSRRTGELDNRGSHFYLALYWAKALSEQDNNTALKSHFEKLYQDLSNNEQEILSQLIECQGEAAEINGYYAPDNTKASQVMRPSPTLNRYINT